MNEPGLAGKALDRFGQMTPVQQFTLIFSALLLAVVYASATIGTAQLVRERRWLILALLFLLITYFVGLSAGGEANSRFRIPVVPFLAILAGTGLTSISAWYARPSWRQRQPRSTQTALSSETRG